MSSSLLELSPTDRHIEEVTVRIVGRRLGWGSSTAHTEYKSGALPLPGNFLWEISLHKYNLIPKFLIKVHLADIPMQAHKGDGGAVLAIFNLGAGRGWVPASHPKERAPAHIVEKAEWVPDPIWTSLEMIKFLANMGVRNPDRPGIVTALKYSLLHETNRSLHFFSHLMEEG